MILVAGFSGIGKTAVVNEIHKPIVRQHGYFIKGKAELSGSAAENRFNLLFQKFIQIFTTSNHPLVMFIDERSRKTNGN